MVKTNNAQGTVSNELLGSIESKTNLSGRSSFLYKNSNPVREHRRARARAALKEQIRSAKALLNKSTKGFT